ncbi:hypothetical protein SAMN05421548_11157 [Paraburkholderia lycopersici]|uniref:Uncharacterized protein n=2 Tax=Paraburkholderia lycopersici TaxID=416944 RepID=A0A1G6Q1Z7_9BURK|nr:hypothetical protein SAMN05421548_11157 [Paraburkholderia lycopersici]
MTTIAGTLECVDVAYARTARYRRRGQAAHHRAPRYGVRFRFEGQPPREAEVVPHASPLIVWRIRGSKPGDVVEILLGPDGRSIVEWTNQTQEKLWETLCASGC